MSPAPPPLPPPHLLPRAAQAYNIQINSAPETYGTNTLYIWGDAVSGRRLRARDRGFGAAAEADDGCPSPAHAAPHAAPPPPPPPPPPGPHAGPGGKWGAPFYWLASLRDAGWWWFVPNDGRCEVVDLPPGCRSGEMCAPESAWDEATGNDEEEALGGGGEGQKGHGGSSSSVRTIGAGSSTGSDKGAHDGSLKLYTHPKLVGNGAGGGTGSGRAQFSVRDLQPVRSSSSQGAAAAPSST
jgi:hypothetical protein